MPNSERYSAEQRRAAGLEVARKIYPEKALGWRASLVIDWDNQPARYWQENFSISLQLDLTRALELLGRAVKFTACDKGCNCDCEGGRLTREIRDFLSQRAK
jgi:hypothetical protein